MIKANTKRPKNDIKRIVRLLSNHKLLRESTKVYVHLSRFVVTEKHPVILVDWSHADAQTDLAE